MTECSTWRGPTSSQCITGRVCKSSSIAVDFLYPPQIDLCENYHLVKFECNTANAWHKPDAETVIREAQKRQLTNGWDDVRTALSITIR